MSQPEASSPPRVGYALLLALAVVFLWLRPLASSLWLDELETDWIVRDGPLEAIHRIFATGRPSGLPYMIGLATLVRAFGESELILRAPSVVGVALATALIARLGARLRDRETGLIAAAIFAVVPGVAYAAGDARWYALALAAGVASMLALVSAVESDSKVAWGRYALATATLVWFHYLWAFLVVPHGVYVASRVGRRRDSWRRFAIALAAAVTLTLPILFQVRTAERVFWATLPTLSQLFQEILEARVVAPAVLAIAGALVLGASVRGGPPSARSLPAVLLFWHVWPWLLLFIVAWTTPLRIFVPRYALCGAPGLALLVAWGVRSIEPARARLAVVSSIVAFGIGSSSATHESDDFPGALAAVNARTTPATAVLVHAMFPEAVNGWWKGSPERTAFLLSSVKSAYTLQGTPRLISWGVDDETARGLEESIAPELSSSRPFFLIERRNAEATTWLSGRIATLGWSTRVSRFGDLYVAELSPPLESPR